MNPEPFSAYWADFFYLAYRTLVIVCSMLALAMVVKPDQGLPCPDSVTEQFFTQQTLSPDDHAALVAKVLPKLRMMRLVRERLPKTFIPYKQEPAYKLTYYIEKLSCGHELIHFPQAGPLAKRRNCPTCAFAASLPEKKPSTSVGIEREKTA